MRNFLAQVLLDEKRPILERFRGLGRAMAIASGWWLLVLSFLTCFEIVARKAAGFSFQGIDEISGYSLAITASLGFTWCLVTRAHTRVDIFLGRLRPAVRAVFNAVAYVGLAIVACLLFATGIDVLRQSVELQSRSTTPLQTPMWIPHGLWLFGIFVFALATLAAAVQAIALLVHNRKALNALYGPLTVEEEIALEAGELRQAPGKTTP